MNLTDVLDLLGALLLVTGIGIGLTVLVGLWLGFVAAGLLVLLISWLVTLRNTESRGDSK